MAKETKKISADINIEKFEKIKEIKATEGLTVKTIINNALDDYFEKIDELNYYKEHMKKIEQERKQKSMLAFGKSLNNNELLEEVEGYVKCETYKEKCAREGIEYRLIDDTDVPF